MEETVQIIIEAVQRAQEELDKTIKAVERLDSTNQKSDQSFQKVNRSVERNNKLMRDLKIATTLAAGAIVLLIRNSINSADALLRQAKALETTTEMLSRLRVAAELDDISNQELFLSLNNLSRAIAEAQDPGSKAAAVFRELGVEAQDAAKNARNPIDVFFELADAFQASEGAALKAQFAQELLGKGSREFVGFMNQGAEAIRRAGFEADEFGNVVRTETTVAADQFNDNVTRLKFALLGLVNEALAQILPDLISLTQEMLNFVKSNNLVREGAVLLVAIFKTVAQVVIFAVGGFRALGIILGQGLFLAWQVQIQVISLFTRLISDTARGIVRLITTVVDLIKSLTGLGSVFSNLAAGNFRAAFDAGRTALSNLGLKATEVGEAFADIFTGAATSVKDAAVGITEDITSTVDSAITDIGRVAEETARMLAALDAGSAAQQQTVESEHASSQQRRVLREAKTAEEIKAIRDAQLQGTIDMFNNMATAAKAFGREGFLAFKAFAIASAIVDTYRAATGAYAAMSSIPFVGPALGVIAAAAAVAAGLANVATIASTSFAEGGLVPGAPSSKDNRMAQVASGEYIFDSASVAHMGPGWFADLHRAIRERDFMGFEGGGLVPRPNRGSSFQRGGLVGATLLATAQDQGANVSANFAVINSRQQMRDFQKREGIRIVVDAMARRSNRVLA